MQIFPCPYLKGDVELTDEREEHIALNSSGFVAGVSAAGKANVGGPRSSSTQYPHERGTSFLSLV